MNIDQHNIEEWLFRKVENDLSKSESKALDAFLSQHPEYRAELEAFEKTVLVPMEVVFQHKALLYRDEPKVIALWYKLPMYWAAAASVILLMSVGLWLFNNQKPFDQNVATNNETKVEQPVNIDSTKPLQNEIQNVQPQEYATNNSNVANHSQSVNEKQSRVKRNTVNSHQGVLQPQEKNLTAAVTNREAVTLNAIETGDVIQFNVIQTQPMLAKRAMPQQENYASYYGKSESAPVRFVAGALKLGGKENWARAFERYASIADKKIEISYNSDNINLHKTLFQNR